MKARFLITLILILLGEFSMAQSNKWIFVTVTPDTQFIYIKSTPVSRTKTIIKIWVKIDGGDYETNTGIVHNCTRMVLSEFDCLNLKSRTHTVIIYDSSGNAVESNFFKGDDLFWKEIVPNSNYEAVLETVCETFK